MIAVEGLCFAGKTTLAMQLAASDDVVMLPEYASMASLPPWPPESAEEVLLALQHFLATEQIRAHAARHHRAGIVVLDRSPLTLIAHEHGMTRLNVPAAPATAACLFAVAAAAGEILSPDLYVHLEIARAASVTRRAKRGNVASHLIAPQAEEGINSATHAYLARVPPERKLHLNGTRPVETLADVVHHHLEQLSATPGKPTPSWRILANE